MDIRTKMGSQKYLKVSDLQGRTATLTIADVVEETVGQGRDAEEKVVLYFRGKDKGLVLNSTNAGAIGDKYGYETDSWVGGRIELFPTQTTFGGKIVDCIRVRIPAQAAPVAALAESVAAAAEPVVDCPF